MTAETADKLGLTNISDLQGQGQGPDALRHARSAASAQDCLLGLEQVYGLKFKKFVPVAIDLRHEVLTKGQADVSIVFTTDPQIKRDKEVLLKDDKGMFPPYNSTLVMRNDDRREGGRRTCQTAVDKATKGLTAEVMQELNARVDLDKKTPKVVAARVPEGERPHRTEPRCSGRRGSLSRGRAARRARRSAGDPQRGRRLRRSRIRRPLEPVAEHETSRPASCFRTTYVAAAPCWRVTRPWLKR